MDAALSFLGAFQASEQRQREPAAGCTQSVSLCVAEDWTERERKPSQSELTAPVTVCPIKAREAELSWLTGLYPNANEHLQTTAQRGKRNRPGQGQGQTTNCFTIPGTGHESGITLFSLFFFFACPVLC